MDGSGHAYLTGYTYSTNFPTVVPLQRTNRGASDAFVAKLSANGSSLIYSTYLGGSNAAAGTSIAVNSTGNAYITGDTYSSDFPVVNALQAVKRGDWDGFVAKLSTSGASLAFSTYIGGRGEDDGYGIAVDSSGNVYVTGSTASNDFPTQNALQSTRGGSYDAFLAKLNSTGRMLIYSTYCGGSGAECGWGIAVDEAGRPHVVGETESTDFPTINALQSVNRGVVTRLSLRSVLQEPAPFTPHISGW